MKVVIFGEPLKVPTSATPGRGMIRELIKNYPEDQFTFVFITDPLISSDIRIFFDSISSCSNWKIEILKSNKILYYFNILINRSPIQINIPADIYLNPDCTSLGDKAHPLVITLADFSVFKGINYASFRNPLHQILRKKAISKGINSAEKIVAISKSTNDDLKKYFPQKANRSSVIYNGINEEWFCESALEFQGEPYFIWWGQISNRKNLDNILKGYSLLLKKIPNLPSLRIIYSNDSVPKSISDLILNLGINKKIEFLRKMPLEDLIENVKNSIGLIFVSKIEGFGMPIIEAMAVGKPVLTSITSSMPEVAGGHAILCNPDDVDSICLGIEKLLKSDFNNEELKSYSRSFSYKYSSSEYYSLIKSLVNFN